MDWQGKRVPGSQKAGHRRIREGLWRLAFGEIADPVRLMLAQDAEKVDVGALDLYSVKELKRSKGDVIEIKFYDRIEALQKLYELYMSGERAQQGGREIIEALARGAKALGELHDEQD